MNSNILGKGWMHWDKTAQESNTEIWKGDLVLPDGTRLNLDANIGPKEDDEYVCTLTQKSAPGIPWPTKAIFKLKQFHGKINVAQLVDIPNIGKAKAWVKKGDTGPFIRFVILDQTDNERYVR